MKLKVLLGISSLLVLLGMSSCSHHKTQHPKDTLRIAIDGEAPTLDPALGIDIISVRVDNDLFAGLVDYTQTNDIIPGLAKSWDISPDQKTYTFHLRPNLKFSDGSALTAQDVIFSLRRLVDPKLGSEYNFLLAGVVNASDIIKGKLAPSTLGVISADSQTVIIKLTNPDPYFLDYLALSNTYIVSQKNVESYGQSWTDPSHMVTSGAYSLKEHVVNGHILATRNPNFYDASNVNIKNVMYYPYVDLNTTVSSYKNGGLDMTFQGVPIGQYKDLVKHYSDEIYTVPQEAMYYYTFNLKSLQNSTKGSKFQDVRLRQALSMAIDRKVLTKDVLGQNQVPLYSTVTASVEGGKFAKVAYAWESFTTEQRIATAQQLYKAAGFGPNHELTVKISYNTSDEHKKVALAIAQMWKNVLGVKTTLENQEWKTFLNSRSHGDFDIARDGWVADYNGVTSYTNNYLCTNPMNYSRFCDKTYDALINKATNTADEKARDEVYKEAIKQSLSDYAIIPLYQYVYVRMVKPYIKNYDIKHNSLDHVQSKWFKFSS